MGNIMGGNKARWRALAVAASVAGCLTSAGSAQAVTAAIVTGSGAVPEAPTLARTGAALSAQDWLRLYDSRTSGRAIAAGGETNVCVTPSSGPSDATGLVLNVTAANPTAAGYLAVTGLTDPDLGASTVNFAAHQNASNLAIGRVGGIGCVRVVNHSRGATHVVIDQQGYLGAGTATAPGTVAVFGSPFRLLDTRTRRVAVPAGGTVDVDVTGVGELPASIGAAILNLTVTQPVARGYLQAYPSGTPAPVSSTLNFGAAETRATMTTVAPGANGRVTIRNASTGTAHVVVDAVGQVRPGAATGSLGALVPTPPRRALDTRLSSGPLGPGGTLHVAREALGIPAAATGALVNITTTGAKGNGALALDGVVGASIGYVSGRDSNNALLARVQDGLTIVDPKGAATHVVVDVMGYVTASRVVEGRVADVASGLGGVGLRVGRDAQALTGNGFDTLTGSDGRYALALPDAYAHPTLSSPVDARVLPCATGPASDPGPWTLACAVDSTVAPGQYDVPLGGRLTGVDLAVGHAGDLRVQVRNTEGNPVANATIQIRNPAGTVAYSQPIDSGTPGSVTFTRIPAGDYWIYAKDAWTSSTTYADEWFEDVLPGAASADRGMRPVTVTTGQTGNVVMTLDRVGVVRGDLVDTEGNRVPNARVFFSQPDGLLNYSTTAGGSIWSITVHPGSYRVCGGRGLTIDTTSCLPDLVTVAPDQRVLGVRVQLPTTP